MTTKVRERMGKWQENVRRVVPYVPGEQPQRPVIKLNTNENPYPPSPKALAVLAEADGAAFRKYPDAEATVLVNAISEVYGVPADQIFVGVGSDDVLGMAFLTYFAGDKPVLFPDITYSFYDVWAELFRIPYRQVPVTEDFRIRPEDYKVENGGIVIANPNAPTSLELPAETIRGIIEANQDSVVIVDEAYIDFGGESVLPLIREYDNLLVVQTYSKSRSGAGMRIGFAMGSKTLIDAIKAVKFAYNSYTINTPMLFAGAAAMLDTEHMKKTTAAVVATREAFRPILEELGFTVLPSSTNFYFATHGSVPAGVIFEELKKRDIFVRHWNKPRIDNYLRITVGTDEEMSALITALREILAAR